jgi:PEGA domain
LVRTKRLCIVMLLAVGMFLGGCGQKPHVVHISSDPSGAMVFFNDKVIGESPLDITVEQRSGDYNVYTFRVVKEDYMPMRKVFKEQLYYETVDALIPTSLHFVLEERKKYPIYITSEPSGAIVTLNGEAIGETPFTTTLRERIGNPRVFDFVAVKEGYKKGQTVLQEFLPQDNGTAFVFPETLHFELTK